MLKKPQNIYLPIDKFQAKVFKHKTDEKRGEWVSNFALALSEEENDDFAKALLEDSQYKMYKEIIRQWRFKVKQSFGKDGVKNPTEKQIYDKCVEEYGIEFVEADELISRKDKRKSATTKNKHNGDASTREDEDAVRHVHTAAGSVHTTVSNTMGADAVDGDTTDDKSGTSASKTMPRVRQNEAPAHGFSGGRPVQGSMSRSPEAAAQSGKDCKQNRDADAVDGDTTGATISGESRRSRASATSASAPLTCNTANTVPQRGSKSGKTYDRKKQFKAPSKEELYAYAQDKGLDEADARDCWEMCESRQWADRDGVQIENWKTFVAGFCKSRKAKRSA